MCARLSDDKDNDNNARAKHEYETQRSRKSRVRKIRKRSRRAKKEGAERIRINLQRSLLSEVCFDVSFCLKFIPFHFISSRVIVVSFLSRTIKSTNGTYLHFSLLFAVRIGQRRINIFSLECFRVFARKYREIAEKDFFWLVMFNFISFCSRVGFLLFFFFCDVLWVKQ